MNGTQTRKVQDNSSGEMTGPPAAYWHSEIRRAGVLSSKMGPLR
jgi:hypothetical protein